MMNVFDKLTDKNFEAYAVRHYNNPQCLSIDEFYEDVARFKYVKRLLRKYRDTGEIKERLVLNHLIAIYNVFSIPAANHMMFYKVEKDLWPALKTFLLFLNYLPDGLMAQISTDMVIAKRLQEI
jgi:hypothetical protein